MVKVLPKLILLLGLSVLAFSSSAQIVPPTDIVMKGALGECRKDRPCQYRVTREDVEISRGVFSFSAKSTGLCYDQVITINNNGKHVYREHLTGTDSGRTRFNVRPLDLLTVYVVEVPSNRVCIWPGEMNWAISRSPYGIF